MKIYILLFLTFSLFGCVVEDYTLKEVDLNKLNQTCNKNDGYKESQRIIFINKTEWQVTCKDGAKFVFDGT